MEHKFDVLILGCGHAGLEAAWIASSFQLRVGVISMPGVPLASAPCNPSIGGVGKGHVVREIDAFGGIMPRLADLAGIQYRTLNESKGHAVQATRVQIDKDLYPELAEEHLLNRKNVTIIREKALQCFKEPSGEFAVETGNGSYLGKKLIVTVGTFLNGKLHCGSSVVSGGRIGSMPSEGLSNLFSSLRTLTKRFKTGTPARLEKSSIDYTALEEQPSDDTTFTFHYGHAPSKRFSHQVSCYLAYTNEETISLISANKEKSPMYNGQIDAIGARYCPSIEDKVYRYPEKSRHHVFIEPEGLQCDTVYPSGISSSLPEDVQDKFLRTIHGLENCKVSVYGYAVEYDVLDTTQLNAELMVKNYEGLYFAGQVNGTSGYEEAAGQGLVAGMNAALSCLERQPVHFSRDNSYIGVMISDLISNLRDEPYRLFTSRSEHRLWLREDNAIERLGELRGELGLNDETDLHNLDYQRKLNHYIEFLESFELSAIQVQAIFGRCPGKRAVFKAADILVAPGFDLISDGHRLLAWFDIAEDPRLIKNLLIGLKYRGYILASKKRIQQVAKYDHRPVNLERLMGSGGISFECKQRIDQIRPNTFGELRSIAGIRAATLAAALGTLRT